MYGLHVSGVGADVGGFRLAVKIALRGRRSGSPCSRGPAALRPLPCGSIEWGALGANGRGPGASQGGNREGDASAALPTASQPCYPQHHSPLKATAPLKPTAPLNTMLHSKPLLPSMLLLPSTQLLSVFPDTAEWFQIETLFCRKLHLTLTLP